MLYWNHNLNQKTRSDQRCTIGLDWVKVLSGPRHILVNNCSIKYWWSNPFFSLLLNVHILLWLSATGKVADSAPYYRMFTRSTRVLSHAFTAQERANECSLKIAWILGQHQKPFTDGEWWWSAWRPLPKRIEQIPMSCTTTARKTEILTEDALTQLDEAIRRWPCIALAVVESTDVRDNARLLVHVRC